MKITRLLQEYVRIDTSNPPGDTRKAADFLAAIFEREGHSGRRGYESAPGKAIVYGAAEREPSRRRPARRSCCSIIWTWCPPDSRGNGKTDSVSRPTLQGNELWGPRIRWT